MALSLAVASLLAAACVCPPAAPGAVVCGSDGLTYSSRCALGCARRQVPGLTVAQEGPCSQPAAALAGPPLEEFGKCRARCSKNYFKCVEEEGCDELSCMEPCFWKFHLECECACKRHLPAAPKVAEAPKVLALDAPRHANPRISRPDGLFSDEYNQAFDCWLNVTFDMSVCLVPCEPAQDEDCAMACVQTAMPLLCQCDLRDKDSSTSARPNTAPTGSVPPGSSPTGSSPTDDTAVAQTGTTPGTLSTTESGNASPSLLSGVSIIVSSLVAIMIARF